MIRSFLRDCLFVFLSLQLIMFGFFNSFDKLYIGLIGIIILSVTLWFLFEKIGLIPKAI